MDKAIRISDVLDYIKTKDASISYVGDTDISIEGPASITKAARGKLCWIKRIEKYELLKDSLAQLDMSGVVVVADALVQGKATFPNVIICDNPKKVFYTIAEKYFCEDSLCEQVGAGSVIEPGATIGDNVFIGCNCFIGRNVSIGSNTKIYHNVVIDGRTTIGSHCCIKSGTVIGQEGYGYSEENERFTRVPHMGGVTICDYVDIGANTCIDRGVMDDTYIGEGSKIDNLCHIAHNVQIGKNVSVIAGTMLNGSSVIEDHAYFAPGSNVRNQVRIARNTLVGLGGVVTRNTEENGVYTGIPAKKIRERDNENL